MMLYRYELYIDDEYQKIGIFRGMEDIFSPDRAEYLTYPFDRDLKIPPHYSFPERETVSFFTEKGKMKFAKDLEAIKKAYEEESFLEVRMWKIEESQIKDWIFYSDEYQVIASKTGIDKIRERSRIW